MQNPDLTRIVTEALARMPQWVRNELSAKDPLARARAEETLAASIAAALSTEAPPLTK